jgi:hypothetical protein
MQMKLKKLFTLLFIALAIASCNKTAGEGGTSSVQGKIWVIDLNAAGEIVGEYYAMDEDVFIIYGDSDATYNDKFATSYDGSYVFNNLVEGKYTLFVYSKCETCPSGQEVLTKTVEITEKKQLITVDDLIIYE